MPLHTPHTDTVVLRAAGDADDHRLHDLAALDSTRLGPGPHLIAEIGGEARAALSLADGRTIADPFHPTSAYVELLRARAAAVSAAPSVRPARTARRFGLRRAQASC